MIFKLTNSYDNSCTTWQCTLKTPIGNKKMILNQNQLMFILNHEIGHYKNGDITISRKAAMIFYKFSPMFLPLACIYPEFINFVPALMAYNHIYALYSQTCEYAADKYAVIIKPETKIDAIDSFVQSDKAKITVRR